MDFLLLLARLRTFAPLTPFLNATPNYNFNLNPALGTHPAHPRAASPPVTLLPQYCKFL